MRLNICFDLGSDTLKVVYAYKDSAKNVHCGKLNSKAINQSAIPAAAFYDEDDKKWIFGNEIDDSSNESFITVVKIKFLFSLLQQLGKDKKEIEKENSNFYFKGNDFPKFYFPNRNDLEDKNNFSERKEKNMTFEVEGYTPQMVCEEYFRYVKSIIDQKVEYIISSKELKVTGIDYSLVYPSKVGDPFVDEYSRIIGKVFGKPKTVISSIKAVSMYAYHKKYFTADEPILFFDMCEGDISVAKAKVFTNAEFSGVVIDAADGHLLPKEIGGDDIDSAIVSYLENTIHKRETIGSPSYGDEGHIVEKGLHSKQYLLMKNVKKAKMILSKETHKRNLFENGVPITIARDVIVQRILTKEELKECIGVTSNSGIAKEIVDYIIQELKLSVNYDVKKVIISGGLIETYGLFEYIEEQIHKTQGLKDIQVFTIETKAEDDGLFPIRSFEDSTFAACLGGVMVNLMNYQLKMCLVLSYGSFLFLEGHGRYLNIFAEKGKVIGSEGEFLCVSFNSANGEYEIEDEEFYSIDITEEQIRRRHKLGLVDYAARGNKPVLLVGKANGTFAERDIRRKVERSLGLKVVTGGNSATIRYYYNNKMVKVYGAVNFQEGVIMDKNGFCTPHIRNNVEKNVGIIKIGYLRVGSNGLPVKDVNGRPYVINEEFVPSNMIVPKFDGLDTFDAVQKD